MKKQDSNGVRTPLDVERRHKLGLIPKLEEEVDNFSVDSALSSSSTHPLENRVITNALNTLNTNKVDKETGKGLSSNDFTDSEKTKLDNLDVSNFITKDVNNLTYYTLATNTGSTIELSINSSTYVMTLNLKNSAGTTISTGTIDLPLESVVVNGSYDSVNKKIILTLQNGNTIEFSVADLVSGLQTEITANNKLSSDLVDDTNHTNKFVTTGEKTTWSGKQDALVSGTNIKTINNQSVLGSGNISLSGSGSINVNGEGESVTLNGTIKYNIKTTIKGNSSQTGTPTPNNQINIDVVTGNNTITIEDSTATNSQTFSVNLGIIELCKIGNYQDYIAKSTGKNLFDKDNADIINAYFKYSPQGDIASSNANRMAIIECKPNTTYTVSKIASQRFRIGSHSSRITTGTVNNSVYGTNQDTSLTITTGENDTYLYVHYYETSDTLTEQQILDSIQIEEGTQSTDYEPFGIGKWYIHKEIGKIVLDGVDNKFVYKHTTIKSDTKGFYQFQLPNKKLGLGGGATNCGLSDYFAFVSGTAQTSFNNNDSGIWWENNSTNCYAILEQTSLTNANNWLSNHNTTIYYVLNTSTAEEITDTALINQLELLQKAKGYDIQTNITPTTNNKTPILYVEQIADFSDVDKRFDETEQEFNNYLPLSGGIMTGKLQYSEEGREDYTANGFTYDKYGNLQHKRNNTGDNLQIKNYDGDTIFQIYPETGIAKSNGVEFNNRYSTSEEVVIGTYNNKPLYRKAYEGTTPNTAGSWKTTNFAIANISKMVKFELILDDGQYIYQTPIGQDTNEYLYYSYDKTNQRIAMKVGSNFILKSYIATFEYTKTTD